MPSNRASVAALPSPCLSRDAAGCSIRMGRSARPSVDPARFARHHAGDRRAGDRRDARLRLVVPRLQPRARLSARLGLLGPARADRLGDPRAGHHLPRRHRLVRLARPRSRPSRWSPRPPIEIEVVSLDWKWLFIYPGRGRRRRQPAGRPGRHAGAFQADLVGRDEQLLRAAARQPDLHHGRHGLAAAPAGGRRGHLSAAFRRSSAATASPTCASTSRRCPPTSLCAMGRADEAAGAGAGRGDATPSSAEPSVDVPPSTFGSVEPGAVRRDRAQATRCRAGAHGRARRDVAA